MGNETFALIVYDAPTQILQKAGEVLRSLRQLSYAPVLVLAPDEAVEWL